MTHATVLPGPILLADPLPVGWRRCSSLGCGAPTGHDGAHVPEAVPPVAVAPAGRWVRRCTARSDCGRPAGHAPPCVPTRSDCTCGPYDPESRCTWCDGLVWQAAAAAAAVAVAGPEVDVGAELAPTRAARIEAAARRLVRAQETTYAIEATCGLGEQRSDALRAEARAFDALRAALCSCTAHGPDLACVEHGEALRRWREENGT